MKPKDIRKAKRKESISYFLQRLDNHFNAPSSQPNQSRSANQEANFTFPKINKPWIITWIAIYAIILIAGLFIPNSQLLTAVKLGGVLLCSIYSLILFPKDRLLQAAMLTTFIADCLLAYNNTSDIGLIIFFLAQNIHLYRLQAPERRQFILLMTLSGLFIIFVNMLTQLAPPIFMIAGFYAVALICNFYTSAKWHKTNPKLFPATCAFAGFALFACCDLCTVVSFMSLTGVFASWFYAPANYLAWFFYYPSQILVSNSTKCVTMESKEG